MRAVVFLIALVALTPAPAWAYIGPGAGAGTIAVVLGILASIVMAFFAILWYPVKRIMKKRKAAKQAVATDPAVDDDTKGADKP
ncbi:hypothetical protein EOI86_23225 [Hwanghaeella grinnelliae]|uniref:Uncharacterized protein n=1 Tax=Hwanghaeella grinnelliae TaxID=2500179 RepID=A0A3S2Z5G9_9PROT|nr:hypothetical protein EOI86_23225 [Hwanghaeella grinnelliae]